MTRDIVMLHGANEGSWCFDKYKAVFESVGWTCHAPDLIGHGTRAADAAKTLVRTNSTVIAALVIGPADVGLHIAVPFGNLLIRHCRT